MGCLKLPYYEKEDRTNFLGLWKKTAESKSGNDYYPFGLTFNSYQQENSVANKYLFNGIEEQDELDLNVLGAFFRTGDPTIGRWWQIDPKVDNFYAVSPYNMMNNNPVSLTDPLGDEWADPKKDEKVAAGIKKGLDKANERLKKANDKLENKLIKAQENGHAGKVEKLVMQIVQNSVAIGTNNDMKETLDKMGEKGEGIPKFTFKQSTNDELGGTEINRVAGVVEMTVTSRLGNKVHEVTHGWNFSPKGDKTGGEEGLEIRAYRAQYAADPGSMPNSDDPWSRSNISDISGRYVGGIRDKNGNLVYKNINKKYKNDYPKK